MKRTSPVRCLAVLAAAVAVAWAQPAAAATVVYQNDFNSPSGWIDQSGNGTGISFQSVNSLFGASFQQTFTGETVRIVGNLNDNDPSGTGGAYAPGHAVAPCRTISWRWSSTSVAWPSST